MNTNSTETEGLAVIQGSAPISVLSCNCKSILSLFCVLIK